jgi:hypothetical protein
MTVDGYKLDSDCVSIPHTMAHSILITGVSGYMYVNILRHDSLAGERLTCRRSAQRWFHPGSHPGLEIQGRCSAQYISLSAVGVAGKCD